MKTFLLLTLLVAPLFISCKPSQEVTTELKKDPKPKHPWEWVPDDLALAAGREIYLMECSGCHNEGEEGAPALTSKSKWDERSKQDLAVILDHAINGFQGSDGKMPARGGTPSLTDEEVTNAVKYMLATPK